MKICLCFLIFLLFFLSCKKDNYIYEENKRIKNFQWELDSIKYFTCNITDTINPVNILINIRNNNDYPYRNIYLFITTIFPNKKKSIDTVDCVISDKRGRWYGKGSGNFYVRRIIYKKNARFPLKGKYKFCIQHAMRDTVLKGITDIGIRIEFTKKEI